MDGASRILKSANPTELLALNTSREVWVALDFLFPARHARNSQSFSRLASLGDTPMCIDRLSVDDRLAVAPVVVEVAHALSRNFGCPHKSR